MTPYPPVVHLIDAILLNADLKRRYLALMTPYTTYFDASGDPRAEMLAVGGFISSAEDWKSFDIAWSKVLARYKVPYFHMKKFVANKDPFGNKKWEREDYRRAFLGELIEAVGRNVDFFVTTLLRISDWELVNKEFCMKEAELTPLAVAGCGALLGAEEWCRQYSVPWNHMRVFIEDGDINKGHFLNWSKRTFGKNLISMPGIPDEGELLKDPFTPLQACDFLTWEARRAEKDVEANPDKYQMRKCFDVLLDRVPSHKGHDKWNVENLRSLCRKHEIMKR